MKSAYIGLWTLLVVSLLIVTAIAFVDDISIGSHTIKKAPIAEALLPDTTAITDTLPADSAFMTVVNVPVKVDSTAQTILIFGDSMTLNLAFRLASYAKQNGHTLHAVNWDSSNTKIWAESDTLDYFIRLYEPTFLFVSLGSNEAYFKKPDTRLPYVHTILTKIGDRPYVWLGPPSLGEDNGLNEMIASATAPGSFFRADGLELKRKKDKIHPTRQAAALWIDSVMRWLPYSSHPFLADTPPDTLPQPKFNIVFLKALNKK